MPLGAGLQTGPAPRASHCSTQPASARCGNRNPVVLVRLQHGDDAFVTTPVRWNRRNPDLAFRRSRSWRRGRRHPEPDPVDDTYRRLMNRQLTVQESRHRLARAICHRARGQIRQEDQLAALGPVLNAVVLWNTAIWAPPWPGSVRWETTSRTRTWPVSPHSRTGTTTSWAATCSTSKPAAPAWVCAPSATPTPSRTPRTTDPAHSDPLGRSLYPVRAGCCRPGPR